MISRHPVRAITTLAVALLLAVSCATHFSPETVRREIARQQGQDPLGVFEVNLGRFTTLLIKSALMTAEDVEMPFSGVEQLQLAVYEAPSETGPAIDVTQFPVRGWEPVLRLHDDLRSGLVLVRSDAESIGDLVVVGAGRRKVVYGRLRGRLSRDLPARLGDLLREGGPDAVRDALGALTETEP